MRLKIHQSLSEIKAADWDGLLNSDYPFMRHAYLLALETTGCVGGKTGWYPQHLALYEGDDLLAALPLYAKTHSMGEYVFDQGWAEAYAKAYGPVGGDYYPKLVNAVPFTPVQGPRLMSRNAESAAELVQAAKDVTIQNGLSSVHGLFGDRAAQAAFEEAGFLKRLDFQYGWVNQNYADFDDFLSALSANRRKVTRRERRDVAALLRFETLTGHEITESHLDALYGFISDTYARKWGTGKPYLTREFFSEAPRDSMVLVLAFMGQECVAGAINFKSQDTLYGRQWGASVDVPFLHFEVCYYQAIDYAIAHGLKRVEAGTQGDHKLSRGYLPFEVPSFHYIVDQRLRVPVANFLRAEVEAVEQEKTRLSLEASPYRRDHS